MADGNVSGSIVISGDVPTITRALTLAKAAGAKRVIPLKVSGAFHSPLMEVAEEGLAHQLEGVTITAPSFPIISNVTAQPVTDPDEARALLIHQLTSPVRWTQSVRTMAAAGVHHVIELGPGAALTGLMKRIDRTVKAVSVNNLAGLKKVEETISAA